MRAPGDEMLRYAGAVVLQTPKVSSFAIKLDLYGGQSPIT